MSVGGGTHIYIIGTNLGTAFAPPTILVGNAGARCEVQPFTSSANRFHCVVQSDLLPPPDADNYSTAGLFTDLPLRAFKDGRAAACWHVGGINHACFVRLDLGGTPRLNRVLTPVLQQGGVLRVLGNGINGGLNGDTTVIGRLFSGTGVAAVGQCGEKDCQSATGGLQTVGCKSRQDDTSRALVYSDEENFGCVLESLSGGQARRACRAVEGT